MAAISCIALLAMAVSAMGYAVDPENPPGRLALDPQGNFYVITGSWGLMEKISNAGKDLGKFGANDFPKPDCMVFNKAGEIFILEAGIIVKFSADGRRISEFRLDDLPFKSGDRKSKPAGALAIDAHGVLYVSHGDAHTTDIDRFDSSGKYLGVFVRLPMKAPRDMAFDAAGNLYVVNRSDKSVEKISPEGKDLGVFVRAGLKRPTEIAFDHAGNFYVYDSPEDSDSCVQKYSPEGQSLGVFATLPGVHDSRGFLIDGRGIMYVVNFWEGRVLQFSPSGANLGDFVTDGQKGHDW